MLDALDKELDEALEALGEEVMKVMTRGSQLGAAFAASEFAAKPPVEKINGTMFTVGPAWLI